MSYFVVHFQMFFVDPKIRFLVNIAKYLNASNSCQNCLIVGQELASLHNETWSFVLSSYNDLSVLKYDWLSITSWEELSTQVTNRLHVHVLDYWCVQSTIDYIDKHHNELTYQKPVSVMSSSQVNRHTSATRHALIVIRHSDPYLFTKSIPTPLSCVSVRKHTELKVNTDECAFYRKEALHAFITHLYYLDYRSNKRE